MQAVAVMDSPLQLVNIVVRFGKSRVTLLLELTFLAFPEDVSTQKVVFSAGTLFI